MDTGESIARGIMPDLVLNRYRIEGVLGEGGLGTVYRAYDSRLKRTVAIKTLKRSLAADRALARSLEERFTREGSVCRFLFVLAVPESPT